MQALKILGGIAQPVDVIEAQALKLPLGDQFPDQTMRGVKCSGVFDPQARERIDVEEATIIDVAGGKPPVTEPVMLAIEKVMQRKRLREAIRSGPVSG